MDWTIDPRSLRIDYSYDPLGSLTARSCPGSQQVTFEYDENARPFRMIDGTGTTYWHYDERGAIDRREDAFGTTYFVYDDAGRRTAIVNAAGEATYYEYDDAGRVTVVVSPFGDATAYQYLNNDLTQSATMGNDVATSYDYDTGNRIRSITHRRLSDSADLGSFCYEYDANSNRVKLSFSGDAVPPACDVKYITYQYSPESVDGLETENHWDAQDDLVFCIDYRYDLCGNRVLRMRQPAEGGRESATTYYDYNELNQLTRAVDVERDEEFQTYLIGATYFEYDQAGNTVTRLTTDEEGLLSGATYYDWDAESQLTGVRSLAGLDNAFAYDGRYQRVEKQQAAGTVRYNWDGLNVLLERDGEDAPLATHTHGPVPIAGIGTHLTTRKHGETPEDLWYHHDAIGSTRQLSDETQPPTLTRQNLLDAWGNLLATAGTQDTPYRFTGKETDPDTGLIYFGRRFYDPALGRWLNRDPARDGLNWYEYAASNPMARVDAEGLQDALLGLPESMGLLGDPLANTIAGITKPALPETVADYVWSAEHERLARSLEQRGAQIARSMRARTPDMAFIYRYYTDLARYLDMIHQPWTAWGIRHWLNGGGDVALDSSFFMSDRVWKRYADVNSRLAVRYLQVDREHRYDRAEWHTYAYGLTPDMIGTFGYLGIHVRATGRWDEERGKVRVTLECWFTKDYNWDGDGKFSARA